MHHGGWIKGHYRVEHLQQGGIKVLILGVFWFGALDYEYTESQETWQTMRPSPSNGILWY